MRKRIIDCEIPKVTKTKKHTFLSMITTFGLVQNEHSPGLVDQVLELDDLFG